MSLDVDSPASPATPPDAPAKARDLATIQKEQREVGYLLATASGDDKAEILARSKALRAEAVAADGPARKPRKAANPPAAPRVVRHREKPARTLRVRIAEIGPHHLEAFDLVSAKDEEFAEQVRYALDADESSHVAARRIKEAHDALDQAIRDAKGCYEAADGAQTILKRLDAKAALVAQLHDDAPESDEDFGPLDPGAVPGDAT